MGTAGARFMVAKQLAASGGLYIEEGSTRLACDPGPGAVVQYAKRKVDLARLDGILVSHRHLDHSSDVNVMIEGMTEGGFRPRGKLFSVWLDLHLLSKPGATKPALPIWFESFQNEPVAAKDGTPPTTVYRLGDLEFTTTRRHPHGAETYGFRFGQRLGWVTDSDWYDAIVEDHQAEVMVLHTVLLDERPDLPHLSIPEAARIIAEARPRLAIITHFGMNVWRAHPWEVAEQMTQATGIQVKAARDGMSLEI